MAGRILIADAIDTSRRQLAQQLIALRYEVVEATDLESAYAAARKQTPDLALVDEGLGGGAGIEFCRRLKARPDTRGIAVILIADRDTSAAKLEALMAGADELLPKPLDHMIFMARVRSLLRARETSQELARRRSAEMEFGFAERSATFEAQGRVALVTTKRGTGESWRQALRPLLRHRLEPMSEGEALEQKNVDVFVIETDLSGEGHGLRILAELRTRPDTRHSAVLMVVATSDTASAAMALDLGANDLVSADFDGPELAMRLRTQLRRKREADRLRAAVDEELRLAVIDPLTGLYNRRYAMTYLSGIAGRAAESGKSYAVMVADLDRFKAINDTYGHAAGDAVLTEVARRLRDNLRSFDLVARIGGEEFLVALPETALEAAQVAGERLRRVVAEAPVVLSDGTAIKVTLSIGIAISGQDGGIATSQPPESVSSLLERADIALYAAKADGRDQISISRPAA